jgi:hypothetical protein
MSARTATRSSGAGDSQREPDHAWHALGLSRPRIPVGPIVGPDVAASGQTSRAEPLDARSVLCAFAGLSYLTALETPCFASRRSPVRSRLAPSPRSPMPSRICEIQRTRCVAVTVLASRARAPSSRLRTGRRPGLSSPPWRRRVNRAVDACFGSGAYASASCRRRFRGCIWVAPAASKSSSACLRHRPPR